MGTNFAVYAGWQMATTWSEKQFMANNFLMSRHGVFREGKVHTLVTHFFSHRDLYHLGANMFSLYFFGSEALLALGARRFLALYMGGGLTSAAATLFAPPLLSLLRRSLPDAPFNSGGLQASPFALSLGASGAVSAVVVWGILLAPFRTIMIFPLPLPLPAWLVGAGFVGWDAYSAVGRPHSQTGHAAHLGGVAWGALAWGLWRRR